MPWLRAFALTALSVVGVALGHLLVTGAAPPGAALLAGAAVAAGLAVAVSAPGVGASALLIGAGQLAGHAAATLLAGPAEGGCLPAVGRGAELGLRIALGPGGDCPPGSVDAGALTRVALTGLVTALAILVGHLVTAAGGGLLVAAVQRGADAVHALRRLAEAHLPVPVRLPDPPGHAARIPTAPDRLRGSVHEPGGLSRRGPPAWPTAAMPPA